MDLYKPVRIGSYTTRGNLFLAPVAGYSDAAFRSLCVDAGCDLAYTEMISSEALVRDHKRTEMLLRREENESEYAVQLFGSSEETLARAARIVEQRWKPVILDLNCGCPVPKIIKTGAGSALMKDPYKLGRIVEAMSSAVSIPVTIKIRLGQDDASVNYIEVAQAAVEAGAAAITLHARTKAQGYAGTAARGAFYALAAAVRVPVFASGDMFSEYDAEKTLAGGKVAGVMFARGAMGDPFIFTRTRALLAGEAVTISAGQRIAAARRQLSSAVKHYGERLACMEFRKHAASWLNGKHCRMSGLAELRKQAVLCSSVAEYELFFADWEAAAN